MSLLIDIDKVTAILLADGWHDVFRQEDGTSSFDVDSYEYAEVDTDGEPHLLHGGGDSGVCAVGFRFQENRLDFCISGPLTAILAVRYASK